MIFTLNQLKELSQIPITQEFKNLLFGENCKGRCRVILLNSQVA
jgi:hypothetical protein